jgi:spermidine synthase
MQGMKHAARYALYMSVFLTGAAVLVIEVTAVRILSPHFGSSLLVLSSVLTVILGALSAGYYTGGKLSDRYPFHEPLYAIIAVSGITVLISEYMALRVLPGAEEVFSVVSGPLLFGMLLFFVPGFLLGIVSPYIVKLQTLHAPEDTTGGIVGATFFWGTLGSIAGSLATGFLLVPAFGIMMSVVGTALALVFLGLLGMIVLPSLRKERTPWHASAYRYRFFMLLALIAAAAFFWLIKSTTPVHEVNVLYESDGLYSKLLVYEIKNYGQTVRVLKQDTNNSSAVHLESFNLVFGYTQFAEFYSRLVPDAERFLMIGAGAYGIPRTLVARDPNIHVTVSDLEPTLHDLAKTYFDLTDSPRIETYITDGRVFLAKNTTTYDVIFGDAFGTDLSIPAHLATREFFIRVKEDLAPEGIFMLNYIGTLTGDAPTLTGSLVRTIKEVFPNLKMYAFNKDNPNVRQNIMFIARNGETPIDLSGEQVTATNAGVLSVVDMEVPLTRFDIPDEYILTDDHAPVEYLMLAQQPV